MPTLCAEISAAIAWSKKTGGKTKYPVTAYFTKHHGAGGTPATAANHDSVDYAVGEVSAVDAPTPHLKGTLSGASNTGPNDTMVQRPDLTYAVEIYPDGTLTYQVLLKGKPVGGMPPTKVQATCVNDLLLTGASSSDVVIVGVALLPEIAIPS